MKALLEAQKFLKNELILAKERLLQVDTDMARVDEAIRQQQQEEQKAAATKRTRAAAGQQVGNKLGVGKGTSTSNNNKGPASKKPRTN